jgi:hypothetical protein
MVRARVEDRESTNLLSVTTAVTIRANTLRNQRKLQAPSILSHLRTWERVCGPKRDMQQPHSNNRQPITPFLSKARVPRRVEFEHAERSKA